jgi:peroxiredoxin
MSSALARGETAPLFTLKDHHNTECRLGDLAGKRVLLSLHPLAWTSVCAKQMQGLEENYGRLEELGTVPLGLSIDAVPSKNAWAKSLGIERLRLLSDFWPHGGVAAQYGLFREGEGFTERANVVIDGSGVIALVKVYDLGQLPNLGEVIDFLADTG